MPNSVFTKIDGSRYIKTESRSESTSPAVNSCTLPSDVGTDSLLPNVTEEQQYCKRCTKTKPVEEFRGRNYNKGRDSDPVQNKTCKICRYRSNTSRAGEKRSMPVLENKLSSSPFGNMVLVSGVHLDSYERKRRRHTLHI